MPLASINASRTDARQSLFWKKGRFRGEMEQSEDSLVIVFVFFSLTLIRLSLQTHILKFRSLDRVEDSFFHYEPAN
ncbi:hypothetical protein CEXT_301541 [Caerostris extrusa]|uniref:Uncharacterized protein n=1 Tax=Caerostris extrusa TaxID=172846 RepID=A0AAV4PZU4_CAEEX|nr:hypothetical protein CEXT_301541 [Caerostris extrusa]